jgi:ADP-heptose:LPS heptosyltransferase
MPRVSLISRIVEALVGWHRRDLLSLHRLRSFLGPDAAISLRWPWPFKKPWQRERLRLCAEGGGIGDELMCTPTFREIKRLNPRCHLTFVSRYPEMFADNVHLDEVEPFSPESAVDAVLQYDAKPPARSLATLMAECVGLKLKAERLERPPLESTSELQSKIAAVPLPRVIIQPQASRWTPNKQWPVELWRELVDALLPRFGVIEVGTQSIFTAPPESAHFVSVAGATSLKELAWVVSQGAVFVGPPSGGMHLANSLEVPIVAIFGGYEAPHGYDYAFAGQFFTPVPCAPCWLTTPCPYQLKCLHAIRPEQVYQAIIKAVSANGTIVPAEV